MSYVHLTPYTICITPYLCNGLACRIGSRLIKALSTLSSRVLILRTIASLKNNMQIFQFFNNYSSKDHKTIHAIPSKSNCWLVYWFELEFLLHCFWIWWSQYHKKRQKQLKTGQTSPRLRHIIYSPWTSEIFFYLPCSIWPLIFIKLGGFVFSLWSHFRYKTTNSARKQETIKWQTDTTIYCKQVDPAWTVWESC